MGTEKYPDENEYSKYLNEHGGHRCVPADSDAVPLAIPVSVETVICRVG